MAITTHQITTGEIQTQGVQGEPLAKPPYTNTQFKLLFDRLPTYITTKYNALITELQTWWDNILSKIVTNGDGLSALTNDGTYHKVIPYTGFTNTSNINVSYNPTNRTITLTETFEAYYNGKIVSALTSGWVSPAHADSDGTYYLFYNDSGFSFTTTPWTFTDLMIAYVQKNAHNIGVREVHGFMPSECHLHDHIHFGTMKYAGGSFSNYTINSTTATNRRPDISSTIVDDEDLRSTLPALTSKLYTQRYLSGSGAVRSFNVDQPEIIAVNGNIPYYNKYSGVTWQQTPFPNLSYGAIFVVAIPTTSDAESQKYRYMFVQPQTVSTNKLDIDNLTPANLVHGDSASLVSEYVFIGKIIIRYASNNWTIVENISELSGNKIQQIGGVMSLPVASAIVFTPTGDLTSTNVQDAIVEASTNAVIPYIIYNEGTNTYGIGAYAIETNIGTNCVAIGEQALNANEGDYCNGIGQGALLSNTVDYCNGVGVDALKYNTGSNTNGFGYWVARNNTGDSISAFGDNAMVNNTGTNSNGFGLEALKENTGSGSNGFGAYALRNNTGLNVNGFGQGALQNNTGGNCSGFGDGALMDNTANASSGFGKSALATNTGARATGVGYCALQDNTGSYSTGVGESSLSSNAGVTCSGVGSEALINNAGDYCNGIGGSVLAYNTGIGSNGVGDSALSNNTGEHSNGFGNNSLQYNTGAIANGVGYSALEHNSGNYANGLGAETLAFNTGDNNTAVGHLANSVDNAVINALENTTCLGANTVPNKSNQVVLGDVNVDTVKMGGTTRTPASATATGVKGEVCWDANYIYVCVDTNTWKRVAIATWV